MGFKAVPESAALLTSNSSVNKSKFEKETASNRLLTNRQFGHVGVGFGGSDNLEISVAFWRSSSMKPSGLISTLLSLGVNPSISCSAERSNSRLFKRKSVSGSK